MKTRSSNAIGSPMPFDFNTAFTSGGNFGKVILGPIGILLSRKNGKMSYDSILGFIDTVMEILDQTSYMYLHTCTG